MLSAAKLGELASCDDMIHDIVSHFSVDLEQSHDLMKELALLKNVINGCEINYQSAQRPHILHMFHSPHRK